MRLYSADGVSRAIDAITNETGSAAVSISVGADGEITFCASGRDIGLRMRIVKPANFVPFVNVGDLEYDGRYVSA